MVCGVVQAAVANAAVAMQVSISPSTPPVYGFLPKARVMGVNILAELDAGVEGFRLICRTRDGPCAGSPKCVSRRCWGKGPCTLQALLGVRVPSRLCVSTGRVLH
jgi:hypothetical protein